MSLQFAAISAQQLQYRAANSKMKLFPLKYRAAGELLAVLLPSHRLSHVDSVALHSWRKTKSSVALTSIRYLHTFEVYIIP